VSESRDPYEVLGVPRTATTAQIRAAYVARARRAHPDLVGRTGLDVMRNLNEAWAVLKDAARRQAWDAANHVPGASVASGASPQEDAEGLPFWTGAMGRPPGRASGTVLRFGIYDRWSLGEIARTDRGYLLWLRDRPEAEGFREEILRLLDPDANEPSEPRHGKRGWRPGR
jgi:curved DNA-binding protein CbpA